MRTRKAEMMIRYVFDLGGQALPLSVQAKKMGLVIDDVEKMQAIVDAAELLTDEGIFHMTLIESVFAKLRHRISKNAHPIIKEVK